MTIAYCPSPTAPINRRTRLVIALSGLLMLAALCALAVPMTVVWIAGAVRGAQ